MQRTLSSLLLFVTCSITSVGAADVPDLGPTPPALGLTVSGGVSLGAFEAGYLYYLFETLKLNPHLSDPRIFTGASAGSANALIALMASCSPHELRPDHSMFFSTWIPVGLKELFRPGETTARGLFTRKPLIAALEALEAVWKRGFDARCDATLGLSTTRVTGAKVELVKDRVTLARTEAKFVVRVRGQGLGKPPLVTNYVSGRDFLHRPLLPVERDGSISFDSLERVVLASGAFPLAFEPVSVAHCTHAHAEDSGDEPVCTPDISEVQLFIDGGVFDNQPLRLAVQLAQHGLVGEGRARRWADQPSATAQELRPDAIFVYVDPAVDVLPNIETDEGPPDDGTIPYALYLLEQLVESSRSKELQVLLEDDPEVKKQITATHTYFMPLSEPLYDFFGFFERDFRVHDFYLGMHSAHRWFTEVVGSLAPDSRVTYPEQVYPRESAEVAKSWAPHACMRFAFDGAGSKQACDGVSKNLRAGIQTSLDRIYARCAEMAQKAAREGKSAPATSHYHCRQAFLGEVPPQLPGVPGKGGFRFQEDESNMEHELRRLASHGFVFRDLGVPKDRSHQAERYVAKRIAEMVRALSDQQSRGVFRVVLPAAGRLAAQAIAYIPPYSTWHVLMGRGLEAGYSGASPESVVNWLRGTVALDLDGLLTLVSRGSSNALKLTPLLGLEVEIPPLSGWSYQTRVGLRGGFGFSTGDTFASDPCDEDTVCSRAVAEVYGALVAYQLLRVQLAFAALPPMRGQGWDYVIHPRIGVELDRP
jgi:predicted acylesterase/phospholipase RssA